MQSLSSSFVSFSTCLHQKIAKCESRLSYEMIDNVNLTLTKILGSVIGSVADIVGGETINRKRQEPGLQSAGSNVVMSLRSEKDQRAKDKRLKSHW